MARKIIGCTIVRIAEHVRLAQEKSRSWLLCRIRKKTKKGSIRQFSLRFREHSERLRLVILRWTFPTLAELPVSTEAVTPGGILITTNLLIEPQANAWLSQGALSVPDGCSNAVDDCRDTDISVAIIPAL